MVSNVLFASSIVDWRFTAWKAEAPAAWLAPAAASADAVSCPAAMPCPAMRFSEDCASETAPAFSLP
ncbi:Uncharacterised protein [Chlamydia abortus]|nr:Uncharacterised protein [Chlamydia abortus]SFW09535.1 Uncharacterised protein [Chlamydia abortus]SGA33347.1 Uncharacterised protein [Chlamydia abortus]